MSSRGLLPFDALGSFMTRVFSLFVIEPGLTAFKTFAAALNMSFSSPSCRTRSPRFPTKPPYALSPESPIGSTELLSAAARLGFLRL